MMSARPTMEPMTAPAMAPFDNLVVNVVRAAVPVPLEGEAPVEETETLVLKGPVEVEVPVEIGTTGVLKDSVEVEELHHRLDKEQKNRAMLTQR